jgi:DNA-binding NarL/FixJ family response regulator
LTKQGQDLAGDLQWRRNVAFAIFATIQALAAVFFVADAYEDLGEKGLELHTTIEAVIAVGLVFGSLFGISQLRRSHRLLNSHERALATASGALAEVIDSHFTGWKFTPSEREVAMLSLKGFDLPDIARFRGVAQGTVRAQLTAIYAKSGTTGRAQFTSFFVEDLLAGGVAPPAPARQATGMGG